MDIDWRWLGVLAGAVVVTSLVFWLVFDAPLFGVLRTFGAMAVIGLVLGWMLRYIAHFNPYDY